MNYGIDCQVDPCTGEPIFPRISAPTFLLMQDDYPLDFGDSPVTLAYAYVDLQADWFVACGVVNEFGQREITGIVGEYRYKPLAKRWRVEVGLRERKITSLHSITDNPRNLMRDNLMGLKRGGRLSDPVNMSKVTITAEV